MIKLKFLGRPGPAGKGVPAGGTDGQIAVKDGSTPYLTKWVTLTKALVGLGNVDNTADTAKPVSTAQAAGDAAVQAYAIQRANHTGTQAISTINGLQTALDSKATPADIDTRIQAVVGAAPAALDTLDELAAALGDDANFAASVTTSLAGKQPLASELTALSAISGQSWGRALLSMVSAAALRTAIALTNTTVAGRLARFTDTTGTIGSTAGLFEDASGNVGVGTASPSQKLDVAGIINSQFEYRLSNQGFTRVAVADTGGGFFGGYNVKGDAQPAAAIRRNSTGTATAISHGAAGITFLTGPSAAADTALIERVIIDTAGNVGIGTSSPTHKLTVAGTNTAGPGSSAQLVVGDGGNNSTGKQLQIGYNTTTNYGFIQPVNWGDNYKNLILNQNGGNVGIGTANPSQKLEVAGNIRATGTSINIGPGTVSYPTFAFNSAVALQEADYPANVLWVGGGFANVGIAPGGTQKVTFTSAGNVGVGTTSPTAPLDNGGDTYRQRTARTPASATAAGNTGDWCWDANFFYVCIATNQWKRSALSTW